LYVKTKEKLVQNIEKEGGWQREKLNLGAFSV